MPASPTSDFTIKALCLDDDIWSLRLIEALLHEHFPDMDVTARTTPDVAGQFQIYFIDNDFGGLRLGGELAARIREINPDAMIIAFSGTLDVATLKSLLQVGCNGVCDKTVPTDLPTALEVVARYVDQLQSQAISRSRSGFFGAVHALLDLLREWNSRLDYQEQQEAARDEVNIRSLG